ncbi:MAG: galactose oxidase-like domain-containing protein [Gaiellaceae bacterium]
MPWSAVISSGDVVAIHSVLVPTVNGDGEILMVGGDNHDRAANIAGQFDHARRFNCRHTSQALAYVQSPNADLFCCGHAQLGDGRALTGGGTITFPPQSEGIHHAMHFEGHRHAFAYNPATGAFSEVASMGFEPGTTHGGGRWYPTLCTLATGEVLAVAGHPAGDDGRHNSNRPERYQPLADRWVMLAPHGPDHPPNPDLFPRIHVLRDGSVFVSSLLQGNTHCLGIDPWTGQHRDVADLPDGAYHGFDCPSVLLPLTPDDGYRPRVLLCGGTTSQLIDLGAATPGWVTVPRSGSTAGQARTHANALILPTGDVLMTGGASPADDQAAVLAPELYSTPIDHATGTPSYTGATGDWNTLNDPATVLRNYHSSALLMPDGRVWTAGGNSPNQPDQPPTDNQKKIEIFDPPYPAGTRPRITASPKVVAYGDAFAVTMPSPQAQHVRAVTLMRCGSSTHAFNPDQRCVFLDFASETATRLRVTAPPHGGVAPPGNYMLFVIDDGGRPCQYASFVRVGGRMSVFTDRSTISQHEVEALLSGPDPSFADAVFVVLDGFTALDIAGSADRPFPPTVTFTFEDDGTPVPGLTAELSSTSYESPTAPQNVAQRISLGFRIDFADEHAFDGIAPGDGRAIRVDAQWGPSEAVGRIMAYRREHVYALDGATPWLSIDVQVVQLARGSSWAGLPPDSDPATFMGQALSAMRTTPDTPSHPFEQIRTQNQTLELADSVGGTARDNFAFARVRFRAPAGVDAADVKVFFRMFTTAATALTYDETTTYRRLGNGPTAVALPGTVAGEVVSQPFFAAARNTNPNAQQDPANVATLHGAGAQEVVTFFGAWLDFNHDTTIRNRIRGRHQCLVAEVHYPPSPIAPGAGPADDDQLSQRNLAVVESDNPGDAASHRVAHTFDLKPSRTAVPQTLLIGPSAALAPQTAHASVDRSPPDELFIRWHDLPRDSVVELYMPDVEVDELLLLASARPGYGTFTVIDEHTLGCRVGDASYLPLPGGRPTNIAGLITIQLPQTVLTGESYRVSAHQISGRTRSIVASFQLTIPVSTAHQMLPEAQRTFDVLSEVGATIGAGDRWRPVFDRYLNALGSQLTSIGGDAKEHGPGRPGLPGRAGKHVSGKVVEILYDCFGDFEGFVIDSCGSLHRFHAREHRIWRLVELAAKERLVVVVEPAHDHYQAVGHIALQFR